MNKPLTIGVLAGMLMTMSVLVVATHATPSRSACAPYVQVPAKDERFVDRLRRFFRGEPEQKEGAIQ